MSDENKLQKNLKLFDVYAIATGAMFSSGFFLLPGLAAFGTGPAFYHAYLAAGVHIIPPMLCMAELSTAMPKSGGTYFFLDRTLGPMAGTVGGLGSWVAVVFKSAFALVGMGAYLSLYISVPVTVLAVILSIVFGVINVVGAKETTMLQRFLVGTLVVILAAFTIKGLVIVGVPDAFFPRASYESFFKEGFLGFVGTIGLVFVSYAGLTKVASVSEEVENPDRNIPLGMTLSLITASIVYTLGTMVMINVLPPDELYNSLTPVADAGEKFLGWIPYDLGIILVVVSAIAAFASTGNAGIMSASRYPYAMAKDKLLPEKFGQLGRYGTPTFAIAVTVLTMVFILIFFDVKSVAKLASAFQLLLFGLISLCVIVMRESGIEGYRPGFRSPLYPWLQIAGIGISFWLILEMGALSIGFTGVIIIACALWYHLYASSRTDRAGAIYHVTARMAENRYKGLDKEMMTIINDRTHEENLSYESVISRADFVAVERDQCTFDGMLEIAARRISDKDGIDENRILERLGGRAQSGNPLGKDVIIWYRSIAELKQPELIIFYLPEPTNLEEFDEGELQTFLFLVVPKEVVGLDLRIAGHIAEIVEGRPFRSEWPEADSDQERRDILMRDDNFYNAQADSIPFLTQHLGKTLGDIDLPGSCMITLLERSRKLNTAKSSLVLKGSDKVYIIGEPEDIRDLRHWKTDSDTGPS
ncbi:MAG: amino acid permease [Verrucomicrobiales bacterium]|nr:amino acid permease [Verrucomicrobiales bacterium]